MKPELFVEGERVRSNFIVDVDSLAEVCSASPQTLNTSPVEKQMVDATVNSLTLPHAQTLPALGEPLRSRMPFSSSFLQPEQFIAELRVETGAGNFSDLSVNASGRRSTREPPNEVASLEAPSLQHQVSNENDNGAERSMPGVFHGTPVVSNRETKSKSKSSGQELRTSEAEKDLESFYEDMHTVPPLELSYEGKPAPAPAHLRTRTGTCPSTNSTPLPDTLYRTTQTESPQLFFDRNGEVCRVSCRAVDPSGYCELESSSAQGNGRFVERGSTPLHRMAKSVFNSKKEICPRGGDAGIKGSASEPSQLTSTSNDFEVNGPKQTGRLRRMLRWGASRTGSMDFLKSLERKLGKKSSKNGKIGASMDGSKVEHQVEARGEQGVSNGAENYGQDILDDELSSPRSSASSVSTTYSEVSSKSQSYKHSHQKNAKSEIVKSKLWLLRVHEKLQGRATRENEDEGDGIYEALRQGATFNDLSDSTSRDEDNKVLNGAEKNSIAKLVAKHKRNSTWDAGKQTLTDHIFSPKQPRLPTRDAHVLLAPPKRLTGDTRETDFQRRRGKPSLSNTQFQSITTEVTAKLPSVKKGGDEVTEKANILAAPEHQALTLVEDSQQISQTVNITATCQGTDSQIRHALALPALASQATVLTSAASHATSPGKTEPHESARSSLQVHTLSTGRAELHTPPVTPRDTLSSQSSGFNNFPGFSSPLPLPVSAGSLSSPTCPGLYSISSGLFPKSPGRFAASPGAGGTQQSSPGLWAGGTGFHSSLIAGLDATSLTSPKSRRLNTGEQFSVEERRSSTNSSLVQASLVKDTVSRVAQAEPRLRSRSYSAVAMNGINGPIVVSCERKSPDKLRAGGGKALPLPASPRQQVISFEQIVAGRDRSPPTDNTLMKFFFKCREIDHLNKFLVLQKRRFLDSSTADSEKCFHMILSEAGAGLSSMVSTLCTAWLLENTMASATVAKWHPIPVMNMSQKEMWQHRDAAWLFHVCGIDANAVLFLDEITPTTESVVSGRVKRAVIGQDILVTKDEVASSCTIVAEKLRQEVPKLLQARYIMTLLLAGILLDTNNLSSGSLRDKQQATALLMGAGSLGRNGFYDHLVNIRDEKYVTSFIREIYGDSNALTGERPARLAQQPKAISTSLQIAEETERATLSAAPRVSTESSPASSQNSSKEPSCKSESRSKSREDVKEPPSKKEDSQTQSRSPQNSKISLAFRRLRNLSSSQ